MIGLVSVALGATWGDTRWGMGVDEVLAAVPGTEEVSMVDWHYDLDPKARRAWKKAHTRAERNASTMFTVSPADVEFMVWDLWCDGKRAEVYKYRTSVRLVAKVDPAVEALPARYRTTERGMGDAQTRFCFLQERLTEVRTDYPSMTATGLKRLLAELKEAHGDPRQSGARRTTQLSGARWSGFVTYTYDRGQLVVSVPFIDDAPTSVTVHYREKPQE